MSGYARQETMPRPDDRRRATGYRILFNKDTERDAWSLSKLILRLSPARRRELATRAEAMLVADSVRALKGAK
jgi:hypothetical protein